MSGGPPSPEALSLGAVIRLLNLAGASDSVLENFVRLYMNEAHGSKQPPILELGQAITEAANIAATHAARGALEALGLVVPGGSVTRSPSRPKSPPAGDRACPYRIRINGRDTSVSLPSSLLGAGLSAFGKHGLYDLVVSLADKAPPDQPRSAHVQQGLRSALDRASIVHPPPAARQ
jgi:hypothetical protein